MTRLHLRPLRRGRRRDDAGVVLPLTALLLVPLLVLTAFAIDLGSWYAQSSKMQRAVDNAALAAVVWMPNRTAADTAAKNVLRENGYNGAYSISYPSERQVNVSIDRGTDQYFSKVVMKNGPELTRSATAEFNKAIPLGSPANKFGTDPGNVSDPSSCDTATTGAACSGIWGAINGPYTQHPQGDPYTTMCTGNVARPATCGTAASPQNSDYKPNGYTYAVDVPQSVVDAGRSVTVEIYDPIGSEGGTNFPADARYCYTNGSGNMPSGCSPAQFNTQFELFDSDGSDLLVSTESALSRSGRCTTGQGKMLVTSSDSISTYKNKWVTLCTFTPTKAGIHPLVVKTSNIPGTADSGAGTNQFSIRATVTSGTAPTVYAIENMSIYSPGANVSTSSSNKSSRFYLASISDEYKGKRLVIDLFDPGDGTCSGSCSGFTMQFRMPPGGSPAAVPGDAGGTVACNYNATGSVSIAPATPQTSSDCTITTNDGSSKYNDRWLRVSIAIPSTYSCTTDCWWTVKYNFSSGSSTDRTVWTVTLLGDPVHLVE